MTQSLIAPTFLFRFSAPCHEFDGAPSGDAGFELDDRYRLPHFASLDGDRTFADVRAAWSRKGIAFTVRVEGKQKTLWCRESRMSESDGLSVWIDVRATQNVHRASRFCHRFIFLPSGGGRRLDQPVADQALIERARENAGPIRPGALAVRVDKRIDGYRLDAFIPADAMTGYRPTEHPRLGFTYAVLDRELGMQTFTVGMEFPFDSDPSLWGALELVGK
jgi:hypothetical protein